MQRLCEQGADETQLKLKHAWQLVLVNDLNYGPGQTNFAADYSKTACMVAEWHEQTTLRDSAHHLGVKLSPCICSCSSFLVDITTASTTTGDQKRPSLILSYLSELSVRLHGPPSFLVSQQLPCHTYESGQVFTIYYETWGGVFTQLALFFVSPS